MQLKLKCCNCKKVYQDDVEIGEELIDAVHEEKHIKYSVCPKCCNYNEIEILIKQIKK